MASEQVITSDRKLFRWGDLLITGDTTDIITFDGSVGYMLVHDLGISRIFYYNYDYRSTARLMTPYTLVHQTFLIYVGDDCVLVPNLGVVCKLGDRPDVQRIRCMSA
jgi:hypothetical protein